MLWLVMLCLLTAAAPRAPTLKMQAPSKLKVGDRASVKLTLTLPEGSAEPLLLTPTSDGPAVEVVRGRLMRSDARDARANPLRFEIPIVARRPGTSVLRVRVLSYHCNEQCTAVQSEASQALEVRAQ